MVPIYVLVVAVIISLLVGHHMGYRYGRTLELFESAKRYGKLPEDKDFGEWLSEGHKAG